MSGNEKIKEFEQQHIEFVGFFGFLRSLLEYYVLGFDRLRNVCMAADPDSQRQNGCKGSVTVDLVLPCECSDGGLSTSPL